MNNQQQSLTKEPVVQEILNTDKQESKELSVLIEQWKEKMPQLQMVQNQVEELKKQLQQTENEFYRAVGIIVGLELSMKTIAEAKKD